METIVVRIGCVIVTTKGMEVILKIIQKYAGYVEEMFKNSEASSLDNVKNVLETLVNSVRKQGFI